VTALRDLHRFGRRVDRPLDKEQRQALAPFLQPFAPEFAAYAPFVNLQANLAPLQQTLAPLLADDRKAPL
jgi:hypothetical protein